MPFINVYSTNRSYGGPEEGGWWYDTGELVRSIPATTYPRAKRGLRLAEKIVGLINVGRATPDSVICTGWYIARLEREPGQNYPEDRPQYE